MVEGSTWAKQIPKQSPEANPQLKYAKITLKWFVVEFLGSSLWKLLLLMYLMQEAKPPSLGQIKVKWWSWAPGCPPLSLLYLVGEALAAPSLHAWEKCVEGAPRVIPESYPTASVLVFVPTPCTVCGSGARTPGGPLACKSDCWAGARVGVGMPLDLDDVWQVESVGPVRRHRMA